MRRKDREVTDLQQIRGVIERCKVARLGLVDEDGIYIVPMNFGYELTDGVLTLYFHCAKEGRRLSAIEKDSRVGFEMDCGHELIEGPAACNYSFRYASIIGNGSARLVETPEEKLGALGRIMLHQTGKEFTFPAGAENAAAVIKVTADSFSCKQRA
ncbi:MAG TPA: pyridoxamine 5'-phosphate oxidase family protein [Candidatus Fimivivens faecavium]|nr:pyridoxamine 5'-phosphate oxidase family protein [Candidatus Fimivivens faecavium]